MSAAVEAVTYVHTTLGIYKTPMRADIIQLMIEDCDGNDDWVAIPIERNPEVEDSGEIDMLRIRAGAVGGIVQMSDE